MEAAAAAPRPQQPLYREILERLGGEIAAGVWAVGDRLPTEFALCRRFGASRHTVRAALRHLQEQGLIVRRQGSGSVVAAAEPQPRFASPIGSLEELMQYAAATRLEVLAVERVSARGALAPLLAGGQGRGWRRIVALRRLEGEARPIAHTEIFLPTRLSGVVQEIGAAREAVCRLVERRYGLRVSAVRQSIEAVAAAPEVAARLGIEPGAPALRIDRRYEAGPAGVIEVARSIHPAERYRYELVLRQAG